MNIDMKTHVTNLLEGYSKRETQIALLHYEMQHTANISPDEMIDTMALGHSDGMGGSSKGHISNKTMYIALNYQERMNRMNAEVTNEIALRLLELEMEQDRLRYYVSLLEKREADAIRMTYFEDINQDVAAKLLGIVPRTMRRIKKEAIAKLAEMYAFAERSKNE